MSKDIIDGIIIHGHQHEINNGIPMKINIMDQETLSWRMVEAIVSNKPFEGGEPTDVLTPHGTGNPISQGEFYLKILKELSDEEMTTRKFSGQHTDWESL